MLNGNFSNYERSKIAASKGKQVAGMFINERWSATGRFKSDLRYEFMENVWFPSMLYGSEVWSELTITELNLELERLQLKGYKFLRQ
jgi:hypothetical protein